MNVLRQQSSSVLGAVLGVLMLGGSVARAGAPYDTMPSVQRCPMDHCCEWTAQGWRLLTEAQCASRLQEGPSAPLPPPTLTQWPELRGDVKQAYIGDGTDFVSCIAEDMTSGQVTYSDDPACRSLIAAHKKTQRVFLGMLLGKRIRVRCAEVGEMVEPSFSKELRCTVSGVEETP